MKHATSRILFAYWDQLRGERAAPERADLEPGAIRHVLADTFILGLQPGRPAMFRLAGTRCGALFGRELSGQDFASLWPGRAAREAANLVETVAADTQPLVAGLIGRTAEGLRLPLELLLLPLRHARNPRARMLGALSPSTTPDWAGLRPLVSVETVSTRVVLSVAAAAFGSEAPSEKRKRFVVLEGGRATMPRNGASGR